MDSTGSDFLHQNRHDGGVGRRGKLGGSTRLRRRWSAEEKAAVVAQSLAPGTDLTALARQLDITRGQLQRWRREAMHEPAGDAAVFVPIRFADSPSSGQPGVQEVAVASPTPDGQTAPVPVNGTIEIEAEGVRLRVSGNVDISALRIVLSQMRWRP